MKYRNALLFVFLIILADQFLKVYIKTHFYYGEEVNVVGNWFKLHFIENEGMAFGMKFGNADIAKLMLTLFRAIAVVFGFFLLKRIIIREYHKGAIISGILILAGAAGNLIDCIFYGTLFSESSFHIAHIVQWGQGYERIFHGRVVDMLYFPLFDVQLPDWIPIAGGKRFAFFEEVFNIADAAVCTGTGLLVVFQKTFIHKKSNIPASA